MYSKTSFCFDVGPKTLSKVKRNSPWSSVDKNTSFPSLCTLTQGLPPLEDSILFCGRILATTLTLTVDMFFGTNVPVKQSGSLCTSRFSQRNRGFDTSMTASRSLKEGRSRFSPRGQCCSSKSNYSYRSSGVSHLISHFLNPDIDGLCPRLCSSTKRRPIFIRCNNNYIFLFYYYIINYFSFFFFRNIIIYNTV